MRQFAVHKFIDSVSHFTYNSRKFRGGPFDNLYNKEPRPQGGALEFKFLNPNTRSRNKFGMTKRPESNPYVTLNLFQHLAWFSSAIGRSTFHPRPCLRVGRGRERKDEGMEDEIALPSPRNDRLLFNSPDPYIIYFYASWPRFQAGASWKNLFFSPGPFFSS